MSRYNPDDKDLSEVLTALVKSQDVDVFYDHEPFDSTSNEREDPDSNA